MKNLIKTFALGLTCLGLALPLPTAMAAGPATSQSNVQDVALAPGGTFYGHVVNAQGKVLEGAVVKVHKGKTVVASSVTDKTGLFAVKSVRGGVYRVTAGQASGVYRFWTAKTAPPNANSKMVLVSSPQVVRGQIGGGADLTTLVVTGTSIGGLVVGISNNNSISDLEDELDDQNAVLNAIAAQVDEIEDIVTP